MSRPRNPGMKVAQANYDSAVATQAQRQADLEKQKFDWQRTQQLYKEQLISRQDYDSGKASYDGAVAALNASQAQVAQAQAAREQANSTLEQTPRAAHTYQGRAAQDHLYRSNFRNRQLHRRSRRRERRARHPERAGQFPDDDFRHERRHRRGEGRRDRHHQCPQRPDRGCHHRRRSRARSSRATSPKWASWLSFALRVRRR